MDKEYDLVVIGTGDAGTTVASVCRAAGWKVAIVDRRPFGGTCSLRGCNPKKAMAATAEIVHRAAAQKGKGIKGGLSLDWHDLIVFTKSLTEPIVGRTEGGIRQQGIDGYHGICRFTGPNTLAIDNLILHAKKICIASGAKPRPLGIRGERYITTTDQLLVTNNLPKSVLFVGGGYISFEFANIIRQTGRAVTIIEALPRPLMPFDQQLVDMLLTACADAGIEVYGDMPPSSIEKTNGTYHIIAGKRNVLFEAEMIVHGAGRVPDYDELNLEAGGVRVEGKGAVVTQYLQSISNQDVYIAGDANANSVALTPVAELEGFVVAHNLIHGPEKIPDYSAVPSVVFSNPQLASVGLDRQHARREGIDSEILFADTTDRHISRRIGVRSSALKVVVEKNTNRLIGASLLGYNVDELINLFALAIRKEMTVDELKKMIYTFPTVTYDTIHRL